MTGTMAHSQTGKISPSSPLMIMASPLPFGSMRSMSEEGSQASMIPEMSEPARMNGNPSKRMERKKNQKSPYWLGAGMDTGRREAAVTMETGFCLATPVSSARRREGGGW
jgi:hypothetical protein